jgi:hypothetical protein
MSDVVNTLAISGSNIYAGGSFMTVNGGTARNYLAALDLTTGTATAWNPNMNDAVNVLAIIGSNIYAGGRFTAASGKFCGGYCVINPSGVPLP